MKGIKSKKSKHISKNVSTKITYVDAHGRKVNEVIEALHETAIRNKSNISITNKAYYKMMLYTQMVNTEIGGILLGTIKKNKTIIDDIILIEQDVSGGSVDFNTEMFAKFMETNPKHVPRIRGWFHSHGSMGTFFSPTDDMTTKEMANIAGKCIAIVTTMSRDGFKFLAAESNGKNITNINTVACCPEHNSYIKECQKEIAKKVKNKTYPYYGYGGYYRDFWDYGYDYKPPAPIQTTLNGKTVPVENIRQFTDDEHCLFCNQYIGGSNYCPYCGCDQDAERINREIAEKSRDSDFVTDNKICGFPNKTSKSLSDEAKEVDEILARAMAKKRREQNVKQSKFQQSTRDFQPYDF